MLLAGVRQLCIGNKIYWLCNDSYGSSQCGQCYPRCSVREAYSTRGGVRGRRDHAHGADDRLPGVDATKELVDFLYAVSVLGCV